MFIKTEIGSEFWIYLKLVLNIQPGNMPSTAIYIIQFLHQSFKHVQENTGHNTHKEYGWHYSCYEAVVLHDDLSHNIDIDI